MDSEVGIKARKIRKNDDNPVESNIVFDLKSTLSVRFAPLFVFLLFKIPIISVAEAPTPNTKPERIDDSIFENSNASEKITVVKYEIHRKTGARNIETKII